MANSSDGTRWRNGRAPTLRASRVIACSGEGIKTDCVRACLFPGRVLRAANNLCVFCAAPRRSLSSWMLGKSSPALGIKEVVGGSMGRLSGLGAVRLAIAGGGIFPSQDSSHGLQRLRVIRGKLARFETDPGHWLAALSGLTFADERALCGPRFRGGPEGKGADPLRSGVEARSWLPPTICAAAMRLWGPPRGEGNEGSPAHGARGSLHGSVSDTAG